MSEPVLNTLTIYALRSLSKAPARVVIEEEDVFIEVRVSGPPKKPATPPPAKPRPKRKPAKVAPKRKVAPKKAATPKRKVAPKKDPTAAKHSRSRTDPETVKQIHQMYHNGADNREISDETGTKYATVWGVVKKAKAGDCECAACKRSRADKGSD